VKALVLQLRLAMRLMREPRVPLLAKALLLGAGLYLVSPLDFVPDVLPLIGQVDDLALAIIALQVFVHWCPASLVAFHRDAIAQGRPFTPMSVGNAAIDHNVIDAEWRREN
jgi:uncharacterized membrane protein YkvA (DUF1232 family)